MPKNDLRSNLKTQIVAAASTPRAVALPHADGEIISVARGELVPWAKNPRRKFDETELQQLGDSLRRDGQDHELVVRPLEGQPGIWQILGGERRWRAGAAEFGGQQQTDFPIYRVRVRYPKTEAEALDIAWRDNGFGVPLTLMEQSAHLAARIQIARESGDADSLQQIANIVGLKKARVGQIEGLRRLPQWILERFDELGLNEKHGRALLMLSHNDDDQRALFRQIERSANRDLMSGNAAVKRATQMRKTAEDDAELKNDNWNSGVAAQNAGSGGVASTAPAGSGSGFATAPDAGALDKRGPRKTSEPTTKITPENIAAELDVIARYYDAANFNAKVPAALDAATDAAIDQIEGALNRLKSARWRALDGQRVAEPEIKPEETNDER